MRVHDAPQIEPKNYEAMSNPDSHIASFTASQSSKGRLFSGTSLISPSLSHPCQILTLFLDPFPHRVCLCRCFHHLVTRSRARFWKTHVIFRIVMPSIPCYNAFPSLPSRRLRRVTRNPTHLVVGNCNSISSGQVRIRRRSMLSTPTSVTEQDLNFACPYPTTHQISTRRRVAQSRRVGLGHESPRYRTLKTLIEPTLRADVKRRLRGLRP